MNREDLQSYVDRWQQVEQREAEEMKNAPVDLLIRQTISIWEIARALNFQHPSEPPDRTWQTLQRKWLETNG
jgi:hypothetical protein